MRYFTSTTAPKIKPKSVYSESFVWEEAVYLAYPESHVIPEGLTEITEAEWLEKKPIPPEPEPSEEDQYQSELANAIKEGVDSI